MSSIQLYPMLYIKWLVFEFNEWIVVRFRMNKWDNSNEHLNNSYSDFFCNNKFLCSYKDITAFFSRFSNIVFTTIKNGTE